MSVLESLSGNIADFIVSILDGIFLFIDGIVYQLLGYMYNLFNVIASARVLSQDTLATLANRVYIVIGVVALFLVAYALLTAIIDPDKASKGEASMGKILPNIAIAIVAIAVVPTVFSYAYRIQKIILCDNVIAKWILDTNPTSSDDAGAYLATTLFQSFYYPKGDNGNGIANENEYNTRLDNIYDSNGQSLTEAFNSAKSGEKTVHEALKDFGKNITNGEIGYFIIISTLAGGYCVYVLLNYCFDAAKRAVKLAYLQLIAPLPILTIIIPGQKKIFQNWLKKTISCFTEIFVRIFVIVIVAFIAENLPDLVFNMSSMFNDGYGCVTELSLITALLVKALLILGLFAFAKEAPKLISDITGFDSKGFKLGIGDRLKESGPIGGTIDKLGSTALGGAAGALTGGIGGAYASLVNGAGLSGFKYGMATGFKNKGNQFGKVRQNYYTDVVKGKGRAGMFGGQAFMDKYNDSQRKASTTSYNDSVENRLKGSKQYRDKMNELLNGTVEQQYEKIAAAKVNYDAAKSEYDKNEAIIGNFEKSKAYKNLESITKQETSTRADELMRQRYGSDYAKDANHKKEYERLQKTLQQRAIMSTLQGQITSGEFDDSDGKGTEYLRAVWSASGVKSNYDAANAQLKSASNELESADKAALDYFRTLKTDDKELSMLKDQAQFVTDRANEKAAKDYANSLEGQKQIETYAAAMKNLNNPGSGKGISQPPAGGSKPDDKK